LKLAEIKNEFNAAEAQAKSIEELDTAQTSANNKAATTLA
jgi:hypothetical protein